MNGQQQRQIEIIQAAALSAQSLPMLASGLWFHHDIRDNFYYASYLFAAAVDEEIQSLLNNPADSKKKAESVLERVLQLQQKDPDEPLYGHFPLNLNPSPELAKAHELPVELMGSLMVYFYARYGQHLGPELQEAFERALHRIYEGGFYKKPLQLFNHHEAKYTAAKIIFGQFYEDQELLQDGIASLKRTMERVTAQGMPEYGALPWFWHWVQAFTCAWELTAEPALKQQLAGMLDYLWRERALFYLKGAWVGAHSRGWPHDAPADRNVLHDYVQFGDFPLGDRMPRTEYAGFLCYPAPEDALRRALERNQPEVVTKQMIKIDTGEEIPLHSYAYVTKDYAAGGIWERVKEFDNEQIRWMVSFPVTGETGVNQLYFFHPGEGWREGDPRHQSEYAEVLYDKNRILTLFPVPEHAEQQEIIGVLPKGTWIRRVAGLYGQVQNGFVSVLLHGHYTFEELEDYNLVRLQGKPAAAAVEILGRDEAEKLAIGSLAAFAERMGGVEFILQQASRLGGKLIYTGISHQDLLELIVASPGQSVARKNGEEMNYFRY
ncbi:hypothetical protein PghCCS26_60680 [Paenibacillus glycanilyticus]|uniref:Uncharacterized protein n=1 Tax=Paenibacillus glycanilyticus TaxID=126569 RepID=A0ABQ6NWH1_9BACL|nr:hypothetical protein [Paenibacillus glycanilyticus]GMK48938.1 hypothetical protein PghCCS26_60680 [Paenibacillus glycanilyticus]